MSNWLKVWTPELVQGQSTEVERSQAFANYLQQRLGSPYPTVKDMVVLRGKAKALFKQYPHADWRTLCKIVDYCKARKYRPARAFMVLDRYSEAWAAGHVPELDFNYQPPVHDLDAELSIILQTETHPAWRRRLVMAQGPEAKKGVLAEWRKARESTSTFQ